MAEIHKKGDGTETQNGDIPVVAPINMGKNLTWNEETKQYDVHLGSDLSTDFDALSKRIKALEDAKQETVQKIEVIERTTEVFNHELLIGMPFPYAKEEVPQGYIALKGQTITEGEYPKLFAMYGANLPDMRGEFIRGWDNGRGMDPGREIGTSQKGSAVAYDSTEDANNVVSIINASDTINDTLEKRYAAAGYDLPSNVGDTYSTVKIAAVNENDIKISLFDDGERAFRIGVSRPRNVAYQWICLAG